MLKKTDYEHNWVSYFLSLSVSINFADITESELIVTYNGNPKNWLITSSGKYHY